CRGAEAAQLAQQRLPRGRWEPELPELALAQAHQAAEIEVAVLERADVLLQPDAFEQTADFAHGLTLDDRLWTPPPRRPPADGPFCRRYPESVAKDSRFQPRRTPRGGQRR